MQVKILLLIALTVAPFTVDAQTLPIREVKTENAKRVISSKKYSGERLLLHASNFYDADNYYDGLEVMFLPPVSDASYYSVFYDAGLFSDSHGIDDIISEIPTLPVYCPGEYINGEAVIGESGSQRGVFTKRNHIDNQVFTIVTTYVKRMTYGSSGSYIENIWLIMRDKDGRAVVKQIKKYNTIATPIMILDYFKKAERMVGNRYVVRKSQWFEYAMQNLDDGKYSPLSGVIDCTELCYMKQGEYYMPTLIFKDENSKERYYALDHIHDIDSRNMVSILDYADDCDHHKDYCTINLDIDIQDLCAFEQEKKAADIAKQNAKANAVAAASARKKRLISLYGEETTTLILQRKVKIGWSKEMCREAWGTPSSINTTTYSSGSHEQWVYGTGRYLYFDNGRLTAIQQ